MADERSNAEKAADRNREAAKWLVASFGAVGAVLVAGLQVSSIARLDECPGDDCIRLGIAAIGFLAGVGSVAVAVSAAAGVIVSGGISLSQLGTASSLIAAPGAVRVAGSHRHLVTFIEQTNPQLLAGVGSLSELDDKYRQARGDASTPIPNGLSAEEGENRKAALEMAGGEQIRLSRIVTPVMDAASVELVRYTFRQALQTITYAAVVGSLAILAFAWAANPPAESAAPSVAVSSAAPVAVLVDLTDAGNELLRERAGVSCHRDPIEAIAIKDVDDGVLVVTEPLAGCTPIELVVTESIGHVFARSPLQPGLPDATPTAAGEVTPATTPLASPSPPQVTPTLDSGIRP